MNKKLVNQVEALIFASGLQIKKQELYQGLKQEEEYQDISKKDIDIAVEKLREKYNDQEGVTLYEFGDFVQLGTNAKYGEIVSNMLQIKKERELTKTLLETLAIICYKQPITRSEIEDLRDGKSCDYSVSVLLSQNLIKAVGKKDKPGYPTLYGTTDEFLRKFDLKSLQDMPNFSYIEEKVLEKYDKNLQSDELYRQFTFDFKEDEVSQEERLKEKLEDLSKAKQEIEETEDRLQEIDEIIKRADFEGYLSQKESERAQKENTGENEFYKIDKEEEYEF